MERNIKEFNSAKKVMNHIHTVQGLEELHRVEYFDGVYFVSNDSNTKTPYATFVNFNSQGEWEVTLTYNSKQIVITKGIELVYVYKDALCKLQKVMT